MESRVYDNNLFTSNFSIELEDRKIICNENKTPFQINTETESQICETKIIDNDDNENDEMEKK